MYCAGNVAANTRYSGLPSHLDLVQVSGPLEKDNQMHLINRIAKELKGRATGNRAVVCCPAHRDTTPSLSVCQIAPGMLLVKCHAGCEQSHVIAAMKDLGLWPDSTPRGGSIRTRVRPELHLSPEDLQRQMAAREIWQSAIPIPGTPAETYLRSRNIKGSLPRSLRFAHLVHGPTRQRLPALVASIVDPDDVVIAVQRTFLKNEGLSKAEIQPQKMTIGPMLSGAVRLFAANGGWIGLAEGVETALSAQELFTIPVWAACGARLHSVEIPSRAKGVVIFADNGSRGIEIAERAKDHFAALGHEVVINYPKPEFKDWNDVATGNKIAANQSAEVVA